MVAAALEAKNKRREKNRQDEGSVFGDRKHLAPLDLPGSEVYKAQKILK